MPEQRLIDTLTPWERLSCGMPLPADLEWVRGLVARVAELEKRETRYQTRLARIASMAGNPNAAQACRLIIQAATEPV